MTTTFFTSVRDYDGKLFLCTWKRTVNGTLISEVMISMIPMCTCEYPKVYENGNLCRTCGKLLAGRE